MWRILWQEPEEQEQEQEQEERLEAVENYSMEAIRPVSSSSRLMLEGTRQPSQPGERGTSQVLLQRTSYHH